MGPVSVRAVWAIACFASETVHRFSAVAGQVLRVRRVDLSALCLGCASRSMVPLDRGGSALYLAAAGLFLER